MPAAVGRDRAPQSDEYPNPEISGDEFAGLWARFREAFVAGALPAAGAGLLDFSGALLALKLGHHIARDGWNGQSLYVTLQAGYPDGIEINRNTANATGLPEGTLCSFRPYMMLCVGALAIRQGAGAETVPAPQFVPWVPSVTDVLADDWRIVERPAGR
jgi:hypothetical protein